MQLREGDEVVGMSVIDDDSFVLTVCENGYGKRTEAVEYRHADTRRHRPQGHPDQPAATGPWSALACVTDRHEVFLVTEQGQIIRMKAADLRPIGRDTQGVKLMDLAEGDRARVAGDCCWSPRTQKGPKSQSPKVQGPESKVRGSGP